jgi:hypothetical protein
MIEMIGIDVFFEDKESESEFFGNLEINEGDARIVFSETFVDTLLLVLWAGFLVLRKNKSGSIQLIDEPESIRFLKNKSGYCIECGRNRVCFEELDHFKESLIEIFKRIIAITAESDKIRKTFADILNDEAELDQLVFEYDLF